MQAPKSRDVRWVGDPYQAPGSDYEAWVPKLGSYHGGQGSFDHGHPSLMAWHPRLQARPGETMMVGQAALGPAATQAWVPATLATIPGYRSYHPGASKLRSRPSKARSPISTLSAPGPQG